MPTPISVLLSGLPNRTMDQSPFDLAVAQLMTDLPTFGTQVNALVAALNSLAAGTAYAIPYTFSTTTTDSDPGAGALRLSSATQNTSTVIRADLLGSDASDWTSILDDLDASSSSVKGQIRLVKLADPTKWLTFKLTSRATPSGYRNLTVIPVAGSSASPFTNGDMLVFLFTRTGDIGPSGTILRRPFSTASSSTPTPDCGSYDIYSLTALAANAIFGAPTGTPLDGQGLMLRVKDNGTARTLVFNSAYNASADLPLPTSTVASKTLVMGFIYNAGTSKWDLIGVLNNL